MSTNSTSGSEKRPPKAEVLPGDVLAGKFRVERVVGRGGMGVVVEATNLQLDQKVALKLLATNTEDPSAVERFNREARAAARLRSEHVARVYDVGKDTLHGPFIVMEMLEGKTLADVIATSGRVPLHRAVEYIIDACEGLAEAHARGIVHQDVKPANLFLVTGSDGRPSVKLLDFGIATMRSKEQTVDAKSSQPSLGTPAYL
ncbi:MAG TPA: serine/threonine-protein kinase, partial [Labilithrix sp.]|nr:serine/threonine-protein kinase [Labilithrix sp.]